MILYIRNALGFFIQLFPCALMIFLPFSPETYRFRCKQVFTWMTVITVVLAALFPAALYLCDRHGAPIASFQPGLLMLLAVLLVLAVYAWMVREMPIKKILVFSVVLFYAVSQFFLVNTLLPYLPLSADPERFVYSQGGVVLYAATTALLLPLTLVMMIRPLGEYIREIEPQTMRREFVVVTVSTSIYFVLTLYCDTAYRIYSDTGEAGVFQRYLLPLLLFVTLNQVLIYWLVFRELVRRKRDMERQRFLEIQRLQYDKIAGEMEKTSRLRHDLRHHLNALGALNAQGRQEEITEYLKQYVAVYDKLSKQSFSGDLVVDSVLEYYMALAGEANIPVNCQITLTGGTGVEPADMTVLLGNCLENALEALRQIPEGQRWLSVEIIPVKSMIVLRIQNTCGWIHHSEKPAGWKDFASSKEPGRRGVGLHSVTVIAEKYDGSAQFQCKDGVFTTRVILNPASWQE